MKTIAHKNYKIYSDDIDLIGSGARKMVINTLNAHSYIIAKSDNEFRKSLEDSDILLPDGEGIVLMSLLLYDIKITKIAGADIHSHLLDLANKNGLKCFYLGASKSTLDIIKTKQELKYPKVRFGFYSPPFTNCFSELQSRDMINRVNCFEPDILFVGMTAPKQEKWVYEHKDELKAKVICSIGAVFDFVAETKKRAPKWMIRLKLEWLYRSFTAWRLTKRYLYSTPLFLIELYKEKHFNK